MSAYGMGCSRGENLRDKAEAMREEAPAGHALGLASLSLLPGWEGCVGVQCCKSVHGSKQRKRTWLIPAFSARGGASWARLGAGECVSAARKRVEERIGISVFQEVSD